MKTRAAVLRKAPGDFEILELELDDPRKNEIQVKLVASGLCHSDDHIKTGDLIFDHYPVVCGHEGAGIVEAVGPDTTGFEVGDHVIFTFLPVCGRCRWCAEGLSNLCDSGANTLMGSRIDDPTSFRLNLDGEPIAQMGGIGTFAEHTVVSAMSAVKVPKDLPLETLCLLGCGVGTGWGAAVYSAEVNVGDVVIVMGIGGIGINAIQGASHAGATTIIAVDPLEFKRSKALEFGATHGFATIEEAADFARSVTNGQGADKAVVTVGITTGEHVAQAFDAIRKAGTVVVTGLGDMKEVGIPISPWLLAMMQKRIQGSLYGANNPLSDIHRQIRMYQSGQLKLDELITRTYTLDEVAQGYADMHAGTNIRGIITYS